MAESVRKQAARRTKTRANRASPGGRSSSSDGRKLVIVESPAKAKTINRYLGKDYVVKASMGHVRDLPTRDLGVDIEHGFAPTYQPLSGRRKVLADLKRIARNAPEVYLATDLDREGEAIAWHLAESLKVPAEKVRRVIFNEITASAVRQAFDNPRTIDMNKVNAQQARRILDRIVGYKVSPLLWKKVAAGLSAGRVQSVAVRLIVEREREIESFVPDEYWRVTAIFTPDEEGAAGLADEWRAFLAQKDDKGNPPTRLRQQEFLAQHDAFRAELVRWKGERFRSADYDQALAIARALGLVVEDVRHTEDPEAKGPAKDRVSVAVHPGEKMPDFVVRKVNTRDSKSRPPAPFTTATLQQTAAVRLRFSASRTMRTAQQLYEGVNVPGMGSVGLITYMRTDSRHLSAEAVRQVRDHIIEKFGQAYLPDKPNRYASGERAQEAHEAIRPTDVSITPDDLRGHLKDEHLKLYELIWRRFVACQMCPAVWNVTEADIVARTDAGEAIFKAMGRTLAFDGHLRVAGMPREGEPILPPLQADRTVAPVVIDPTQHFTQAPPRYTEASLVKALEAENIGRPSTYAAIIQTIQDRKYVEQQKRAFYATDLGMVVTDKLVRHFPRIFDVQFTSHMEDQLDKVEDAHAEWVAVLDKFYGPFKEHLEKASEEMVHAKAETQPSDHNCPDCDAKMEYRFGRNGRFLSCSRYPDCKCAIPVDRQGRPQQPQKTDIACPKCASATVLRKGRYGPFLSCSRYPDCDGIVNLDRKGCVKHPAVPPLEVDLPCPKCQSPLYLRRGKRGPWLSCSKFPKCRGRQAWTKLPDEQRKQLELKLMNHEKANPQPTIRKLDGAEAGENCKPQVEEKTDS